MLAVGPLCRVEDGGDLRLSGPVRDVRSPGRSSWLSVPVLPGTCPARSVYGIMRDVVLVLDAVRPLVFSTPIDA